MSGDNQDLQLPLKAIFKGSLVAIVVIIIITFALALLTEFGWTITVFMPGNMYLLIVYTGIIIGAISAGKNGLENGWLTGIAVGALTSLIVLLMIILISKSRVNVGIYTIKSLINSFIGAFGGIIGVNIGSRK